MATTLSLVPIQALSTTNSDGVQMSGPYILVRATTVAQQVQATRQLGKKPISPLPKEPEALRCKRRTDSNAMHNILPRPQPAAVARRNERERNRVKMVNTGFDTLREHVPFGKKNKKMSKVDTLKAAADYIKYLQEILNGDLPELPSEPDLGMETETSSVGESEETEQRLSGDFTDISDSENVCDKTNDILNLYNNSSAYSENNNNTFKNTNINNSQNFNNNNNQNDNDIFSALQDNENFSNFSFCAALRESGGFNIAPSPAVSSASSLNSPSPSMTSSDAISESLSSEEDELPDLGSWFS